VRNRDRDFRPSRHRDFADDDYQPPSRDFGYAAPRGPQFDIPSGPPIQATVKWYNPDKGFGFVELGDGSGDAFLHVSVVERSGNGSVNSSASTPARHCKSNRGVRDRSDPDILPRPIEPRLSSPAQ
jgi:cold shock protein